MTGAQRDVIAAGLSPSPSRCSSRSDLSRAVSRAAHRVAQRRAAIAAGDLERRAALDAPGELGDLALSLQRMTVQLASRLSARRADEALLVQLTESLNEGIVGVSARGSVIRINETGRRLLGVSDAFPSPST